MEQKEYILRFGAKRCTFCENALILAAGKGTRMWPLSREHSPKQFLPLVSAKSMFQETVSRLEGMGAKPPLVVCNDIHRFMLSDQP